MIRSALGLLLFLIALQFGADPTEGEHEPY